MRIAVVLMLVILSSFVDRMPTGVLSKGLLDMYSLTEGAGLIAFNQTKVNIDGPIQGAVYQKRERGNCLYFDGTNASLITLSKKTDLVSSPITVSCWVRFDALGTERYIFSDLNAAATYSQFAVQKLTSNVFRFAWFNSPSTVLADGTTAAVAGIWYHVVGTRSGVTGAWSAKLYKDGVLERTTSSAVNPATQANAGTPSIGTPGSYTGGTTFHMNGCIQLVKVWRRALTETEVRNLYLFEKTKVY